MKVVAIAQARMGSTRLPGKILMDLGGHPVLEWVVRACASAPGVDEVYIATSTLPADDVVEQWCKDHGVNCYRGSEADVLSRFMGCANASGGEVLLRLTADCPWLDPQVIGAVVRLQKQSGAAFVTNVSPRTYSDGLDVQAFTYEALAAADAEATRPLDRDGVCTWIERNRSRFPAETVINPIPGLADERWVLDTAADLEFCHALASYWPWEKGPPSQLDILGVLDAYPELRDLNADHICNERYTDALAEEPIYERTFDRSQAQFRKAREVIPLAAQTFSKSHLQYAQPSPLFLSHGQGGLVWDIDGNEYVDVVGALLPNVLGYRDADVDAAVRRQLSSGVSFTLATELEAELAETLCRLIPCAEAVRYGKSGTDVTTAAVRLARAHTGREQILICGGYHGWQDWSIERDLGVPVATRSLTDRIDVSDTDAAECLLGKGALRTQYAACIVEPECGSPFLRQLRELCDRTGTVLIFDEVISGFRFDLGGAQALYGVTPDLATFGKAMANGMPLSAIVGRKDIMRLFEPPDNIFYSGTMFGETLSLAASIATIKKMERDNIIPKLRDIGRQIVEGVNRLRVEHDLVDVIKLQGVLSFTRLKFRDDQVAALFRREMVNSGTLITASNNVCAAHGPSEIKRILRSYDHAMGVVADAIRSNDIEKRLAGASVGPMVRSA